MSTLNEKIINTYTGYQTLFNDIFGAKGAEDISTVASIVQSNASAEQYPALIGVPQMREFKDKAQIQNLIGTSYTVENKEFEATVNIALKNYQDDTLGMFDAKIKSMAANAKAHPWQLLINLLDDAFTANDYTGKPFIASNKPYVPGVDGLKVPHFSNKGTKQLSEESLTEALAAFRELKDPYGNSVFAGLAFKPVLMVPSALESTARKLVEKDGDNNNPLYGLATVKVIIGLKNQKCWFLADMTADCKPFIYQERVKPELLSTSRAMAAGYHDPTFISDHMIVFQVTSRGALTYGASNRIWGSDGSAA